MTPTPSRSPTPWQRRWVVLEGMPSTVLLNLLRRHLEQQGVRPIAAPGSLTFAVGVRQGRPFTFQVQAQGETLQASATLEPRSDLAGHGCAVVAMGGVTLGCWLIECGKSPPLHLPSIVTACLTLVLVVAFVRRWRRPDPDTPAADRWFHTIGKDISTLVEQMHQVFAQPLLVEDPKSNTVRLSPVLAERMLVPGTPPAPLPEALATRAAVRRVHRGVLGARPSVDARFRRALCTGDRETATQILAGEMAGGRGEGVPPHDLAQLVLRRSVTLPSQPPAAISVFALAGPIRQGEAEWQAYAHADGAPFATGYRSFVVERGCDAVRDTSPAWAFAELQPQDHDTCVYPLWKILRAPPTAEEVAALIEERLVQSGLPPAPVPAAS